jgi:DeoR/GlpR family transcriptional regulator of sugar metabolism
MTTRDAIYHALSHYPHQSLDVQDLCICTQYSYPASTIRRCLVELVDQQKIERTDRGLYRVRADGRV